MDNTTTLTAAQILESMRATQGNVHNAVPTPSANAVSTIDAPATAAVHAVPGSTFLQRLRYEKQIRTELEKNLPLVARQQAAVTTARMLDTIDAVRDQVSYHIFLRKAEHGQKIAAAGQVHDERLADVQERSVDRWTEAEARRIVELQSQYEQGLLTETALRQRVAEVQAFYARMRQRTGLRIDGLRGDTDVLVDFGRNTGNNRQ